MSLYAPRKFLIKHLKQLVDDKVIRGVSHAEDFADVMDGVSQANHGFVYVIYDKSKGYSSQGKNAIKRTQVYTLILAWRNNRPARSNHGQGMDEVDDVQEAIEWHVHGQTLSGELHSKSTGKPFTITDPPETFYRPNGWAFYPMSFEIDVIKTRNQRGNS